jgi:riboflavin biosynthesis pyrimidine reductase
MLAGVSSDWQQAGRSDPHGPRPFAGGYARPLRIAAAASTAADGRYHSSIPKPRTISTRSTAARPRHDGELLVPGSGALVRWLLANDLVDQLDLVTYPVVVGQGTRLFPDSGPAVALDLVNSRTTSRGITIQTYRPLGRPEYATSTVDPEHVF